MKQLERVRSCGVRRCQWKFADSDISTFEEFMFFYLFDISYTDLPKSSSAKMKNFLKDEYKRRTTGFIDCGLLDQIKLFLKYEFYKSDFAEFLSRKENNKEG